MQTARFRIGYPYDNPDPEKIKDSVVVLKKSEYRGFRCVYCKKEKYTLPEKDAGPKILQGYTGDGLVGELIESDDNRRSIAREGKIHGEGKSMQLALVLAACAVYGQEPIDQLPLLLFSAAIALPPSEPFLDATIKTYARTEEMLPCLIHKYHAAQMAKAYALVLPYRDAKILANALQCQTLDKIHDENLGQNASPMIVGISEIALPDLAKQIGISPRYFIDPRNPILPAEKNETSVVEENPPGSNEIPIPQQIKSDSIPKRPGKRYSVLICALAFLFGIFSLYHFFLKPILLSPYQEKIAQMDSRLERLYTSLGRLGLKRTSLFPSSSLEDDVQKLWHDVVQYQQALGTQALRKDWQKQGIPTEEEIKQGKYKNMLPQDPTLALPILEQGIRDLYQVMGLDW